MSSRASSGRWRRLKAAVVVEGRTVLTVCRVQDVRATEKDKVKIFESFRPGDIVRAQVVSYYWGVLFSVRGD